MRFLRDFLSWLFAISSTVCVWDAFRLVPFAIGRRHGSHLLVSAESFAIFPIEAAIFAVAWWFLWKNKPSARIWGIAASATWILTWLISYVQFRRPLWGFLAIGVIGVIAFSWRDNAVGSPDDREAA